MNVRRNTGVAAAAVLALGLTASPALAQQGEAHGQEGHAEKGAHGMMAGCPMMAGHGTMAGQHGHAMRAAMAFGPGPMMLLRQKEALGLSEDQVTRLDSLRAAMHAAMKDHRSGTGEIHEQMEELGAAETPDLSRYRELMERMAEARVELAVQMARTHRQAMDVLTEEQRSNARYGMELMHRMMRSHHPDRRHDEHGHGGATEHDRGDAGEMEGAARVRTRIVCAPESPGEGGGR